MIKEDVNDNIFLFWRIMLNIAGIIFVYILSGILIAKVGVDTGVVVAILVSVTCACVSYVRMNKTIVLALSAVQFVLSIFVPSVALLSAICIYFMCYLRQYYMAGIVALAMAGRVFEYNNEYVLELILYFALAAFLSDMIRMNQRLKQDIKSIRDDSEEYTLLLKDKNKRLIEKQDQEIYVATLKERNRIAREIHDNVGHMLTRSILQLGALMTIHKQDEVGNQLAPVRENLDIAMNNIRESVHDLHDESVDLKQTLLEMVEPLSANYHVNFDYDIHEEMSRECKYALIGITKEAISNIIKYSKNSMVDITLREHPALFQLMIRDYDKDKKDDTTGVVNHSDGMGIQNMYDRVAGLGGNISITNENGYKIFVMIPKAEARKGDMR